MSRTYRLGSRGTTPKWRTRHIEEFRCRKCRMLVGPVPYGGSHRNHCPFCLHSRHVDDKSPGDRASDRGSLMAPTGHFTRPNGEYVIVHRCLGCDFERFNRIAADDYFDLALSLPKVEPRTRYDADEGEEEEEAIA